MFTVGFSKTSSGFYSSTHWKCTHEEEPGWYTGRFDDSHWPNARVIGGFGFYTESEYLDHFPPASKFIWATSQRENVVYCRARLCYGKEYQIQN